MLYYEIGKLQRMIQIEKARLSRQYQYSGCKTQQTEEDYIIRHGTYGYLSILYKEIDEKAGEMKQLRGSWG